MAVETICLLFDEVSDYVARQKKQPAWTIQTDSRGRIYAVTVTIAGEDVVEASARDLGQAHRRALDAWRLWEADQASHIAMALEISLESLAAERRAT